MITVYNAANDLPDITQTWMAALWDKYPLSEFLLNNVLANPVHGQTGRHFVALEDGQIVGFIGTQVNPALNPAEPPLGYILGIAVRPEYQRRGIGKRLLTAAMDYFHELGVKRVMAGGKYPRIFPGAPDDLPGAKAFFLKNGWEATALDYDLGRRLGDYETPASVTERIRSEGVSLYEGTRDDVAEVLAFNDREFPGWADTYHYVASVGDYQDFLVARDPVRGVIGTLLMFSHQSQRVRCDALWRTIHGETLGGLGEVGIGKDERGRGMGLAMVAIGSEILKARGVSYANIGFTSLVDFYGRLGYKVWREYTILWKNI
jgi:GNAT superfamily N-acetyltransferase